MRDDVLVVGAEDATWLIAALAMLEQLVARAGHPPVPSLGEKRRVLAEFVGRVDGHADATTRPGSGALAHDSDIDALLSTEEVSSMLNVTADAVRKACRTGRFAYVARRAGGRWWIPRSAVMEVAA